MIKVFSKKYKNYATGTICSKRVPIPKDAIKATVPISTISSPLLILDSPVILVFKVPAKNKDPKDNIEEITRELNPKLRKYGT